VLVKPYRLRYQSLGNIDCGVVEEKWNVNFGGKTAFVEVGSRSLILPKTKNG
jgi:hypothetical protein